MIDAKHLQLLACPLCPQRPPLRLEGDHLVCSSCGKAFPIVDGIPHLVADEAIDWVSAPSSPLSSDE